MSFAHGLRPEFRFPNGLYVYDNVELRRMAQNVYQQSPDGGTERFFNYYLGCL